MIVQSGANDIVRLKRTTSRPREEQPHKDRRRDDAGDCRPHRRAERAERGNGPAPAIRTMLNTMFSMVIATPSRSGVCTSPAARNAPLIMKKISIPMLNTNMMRMNGSASAARPARR